MNNLLHLDIYVHILNQLEVSRTTDESVKVLANCLQTSSTLREAAILSSIWKPHYNSRYRYCDAEREARRKEDNCGDWRLMYAERRRLDRCVLCLTDEIVHERIGRGERAKLLNSAYGFDAWDVLELEARRPVPDPFQEHDENVTAPPQTITRRFWAKQVLGVIARHHALSLWGRLINSRDNDALSFEDSISALSSFFGHPVAEMSRKLDELGLCCREYLASRHHPKILDDSRDQLVESCKCICDFMRSQGFGNAEPANFSHILNHFPHSVLTTTKQTIPLSLVYIFVALARRLGLMASPVNYPGRVLIHVRSPDPEASPVYVDIWGSRFNFIFSSSEDLSRVVIDAGGDTPFLTQIFSPSPASQMLLRAAGNIINSHRLLNAHESDNPPASDCQSSLYAAFCIQIALTNNLRLSTILIDHGKIPPLDCATVLSGTLAQLLPIRGRDALENSCKAALKAEEAAARMVYPRTLTPNRIRFFVGMIFEHIKYGYLAVIVAWEPVCGASEEWVQYMRVDSLMRGRNQPFYIAICQGSQRYVAEENIKPINPTPEVVSALFKQNAGLEMYFEGVDMREDCNGPARGRMLLSPESRMRFPQDDRVGDLWVRGVLDII